MYDQLLRVSDNAMRASPAGRESKKKYFTPLILSKTPIKHFNRQHKQTTFVVIGALRVYINFEERAMRKTQP